MRGGYIEEEKTQGPEVVAKTGENDPSGGREPSYRGLGCGGEEAVGGVGEGGPWGGGCP